MRYELSALDSPCVHCPEAFVFVRYNFDERLPCQALIYGALDGP